MKSLVIAIALLVIGIGAAQAAAQDKSAGGHRATGHGSAETEHGTQSTKHLPKSEHEADSDHGSQRDAEPASKHAAASHGDDAHGHVEHTVEVTDTHVITTHDTVPRFAVGAEAVAIKSGKWSDASIWKNSKVPGAGEKVQIPEGLSVIYDLSSTAKLDSVEVSGELVFAEDQHTAMWTNELTVMPSGSLTIRTTNYKAELVFPDGPLRESDVEQTGKGLLVYGSVTIHGAPLSKTFVRANGDLQAGSKTIKLQEEVDWLVGSRIVLPDTRHISPFDHGKYYSYKPQWEVKTVVAVQGKTLTIDSPLRFDHRGPRDLDGTPTKGFDGKILAPHIGNLSRNVAIRSENPEGVRGHTQFFANSNVNIKYALFASLGRTRPGTMDKTTNHIGRYSVHCHHLGVKSKGVEPSAQWVLQGNSVVDALKWGIVVHDSHFGLVKDNVVYDVDGVAIATEDGSESGNLFDHNFVCRVNGTAETPPPFNGLGEANDDLADQGDGFWFAGPMNSVRNNVVANAYRSAYTVWPDAVPFSPDHRNQRLVHAPKTPQGPRVTVNILQEAFDDFVNNEAYGATTSAIQLWSVGDRTEFPSDDPFDVNTLKNTVVWHVSGVGIRFYYAESYRVDGWIQRGDPAMINKTIEHGIAGYPSMAEATTHAGALARKSWLINADIQGAQFGYVQRGRGFTDYVEIDRCVLDNATNLEIISFAQDPPDGSSDSYYKNILFKDSYSPGSLRAIRLLWEPSSQKEATTPETHTVINYQRIQGLNLDLYYHEQAPGAVAKSVPEGSLPKGRLAPSREVDNDNGETAAIRGKAMGIDGLVFVSSKPEKPMLFCNVWLDDNKPTFYYTVIGDVDNPVVSIDFAGRTKRLTGASGSWDVSHVRGRGMLPLKVTCQGVGQVVREVAMPLKR